MYYTSASVIRDLCSVCTVHYHVCEVLHYNPVLLSKFVVETSMIEGGTSQNLAGRGRTWRAMLGELPSACTTGCTGAADPGLKG